jgi:UrcA family protein
MTSKFVQASVILVFAMALSAALSGGASADPARPATLEPRAIVSLSDLNLDSPEGVRVAYGRIRMAAQQVCGSPFSLYDANRWTDWRECYRATIEATVARIDRPALTAFHRATTKPVGSSSPSANAVGR